MVADRDIEAELRRRYRRAVAMLPASQRIIFLRHRARGETLQTIAQALSLPCPEVERELALALVAIGAALDRP